MKDLFFPPRQKSQGETQAGGQKGRGSGGRNFCPPASPAKRDTGWEDADFFAKHRQ